VNHLLQTKLYIPQARSDLVPRPRLIERLRAGLDRKLTLVSGVLMRIRDLGLPLVAMRRIGPQRVQASDGQKTKEE
jgi:hypothetical protein